MKSYFAYIRVSTTKQGQQGSSLQEQQSAIEAYASRHSLNIAGWYREMETAAKQGRREFNRMLGELERHRAAGVIIHKIDRSARNLKDWAHLGELMDRGVEVHFAHDNLDLNTRGGRLSADIQAVIAADFIRNLRDEVRKGLYGRLKQGYYPLPAPRGYLDCGKAKPKAIDPIVGPLASDAFALFETGSYSIDTLREEMRRRGLRSTRGNPLSRNAMAKLLRNPFYMGVIRIRRTGEVFAGLHEPLVSRARFERVQAILDGRVFPRAKVHQFAFRRLVRCETCGRSLTGERQKGHAYYRCHERTCRGTSLREAALDTLVRNNLALLQLDAAEDRDFGEIVTKLIADEHAGEYERIDRVERDLARVEDRLHRLTDAFVDASIDKDTFNERKAALLFERTGLQEARQRGAVKPFWKDVQEKFELGKTALQSYELGSDAEKRDILKSVTSNFSARGKDVMFTMKFPFAEVRDWHFFRDGAPSQAHLRTGDTSCVGNNETQHSTRHLISATKRHQSKRTIIPDHNFTKPQAEAQNTPQG